MTETAACGAEQTVPVRLKLDTSLRLGELDGTRRRMLELVATSPRTVAIDAGAVIDVDSAGVQLLACFAQSVMAVGGTLHWEAASTSLRTWCETLGIAGLLGLPAREAPA